MAEGFRSGKDLAITVQDAQWNMGDYFTNSFQVVYVKSKRDALNEKLSKIKKNMDQMKKSQNVQSMKGDICTDIVSRMIISTI